MTFGTVDDGTAAFAALTVEDGKGFTPFKWQMRLLHRFVNGDLPSAVDVPTGLGKTAVMALWLIARAARADIPKKLVYVVDRRAVVDQASRFAARLRENMPAALAKDLHLEDAPLPISTLRGGFADNRKWLEDPSKPAIVVGTIDMVGSRLLFEGYVAALFAKTKEALCALGSRHIHELAVRYPSCATTFNNAKDCPLIWVMQRRMTKKR